MKTCFWYTFDYTQAQTHQQTFSFLETCLKHILPEKKRKSQYRWWVLEKNDSHGHEMVEGLISSLWNFKTWSVKASISAETDKHNKRYYTKNCKKWRFWNRRAFKNCKWRWSNRLRSKVLNNGETDVIYYFWSCNSVNTK